MIGRKFRRELHLMIDFVEKLSLILTPTGSQNQPQEGPKSWILGCWRGPGARLPLKLPKKAKRSKNSSHLGDEVGPKLASKLAQVRFQIDIQLHTNLDKASVGNLEPLGHDLEGHLASQIEPESELKTRGVKRAKLNARAGGSSIFEVPRGSESDETSMP